MNLSDIRNILNLVSSKGVIHSKNFLIERREKTKIQELLDLIVSGEVSSDEDAAQKIYAAKATDKKYMVLRRSLIIELIESIGFYDFSRKFSHYVWQRFVLQKSVVAVQALLAVGARNTATEITKITLQAANELEYTEISIQCLRILRETAALNGDINLFEKYNSELLLKLNLQNEELRAEGECQSMEISFIRTTISQKQIADNAWEYIEYLEIIRSNTTSFALELNYYRILLYAHQINAEYSRAIDVCLEAEVYLLKHDNFTTKARTAEFKLAAMNCAMMLGQFDRALEFGHQCIGSYQAGKRNWLTVHNKMIQIHFHRQDYAAALDLYMKVSREGELVNLPTFQKERWMVYKGFLSLFIATGYLRFAEHAWADLSISSIVQEATELVQDKKGLNISVVILQIMFALYREDYELVTSRIYLFQDYAKRYLTSHEHSRTIQFLDLLKLLRKSHFNSHKATIAGKDILLQMKINPQSPEYLFDSHEFLPYEALWEWILLHTKAKF